MIVKCPRCDGPLKFDPATQMMRCEYCDSVFSPDELQSAPDSPTSAGASAQGAAPQPASSAANVTDSYTEEELESLEFNIYRCSACGAEIAVNGNETSTFCAYCGQPTIVFDRVSKQLMPKYILPFSVSKAEAERLIRQKLNSGRFVPDEIKNFQVERIRGIYIPYFLCDISYEDRQILRGTVKQGKNSHTYYYLRHGQAFFQRMTLDASYQLNDESSQRLEPFNVHALVDFKPEYMSGYYADRYDVDKKAIKDLAVRRAGELFDNEIVRSVKANGVTKVQSNPSITLEQLDYVLLPAWFMTFRYQDEPYTILVNGQTSKVVGAVPFEKKKTYSLIAGLGSVLSVIGTIISYMVLSSNDSEAVTKGVMTLIILAGIGFGIGASNFSRVSKGIKLSKAKATLDYVKDRQEGS